MGLAAALMVGPLCWRRGVVATRPVELALLVVVTLVMGVLVELVLREPSTSSQS